jgi:hypothetical protein
MDCARSGSEEMLGDFTADRTKEVLGEKVASGSEMDDNYLAENKLLLAGFSDETRG